MSEERVGSTSDERTANNVMRHEYRILSEEEKLQMQDIKDLGAAFIATLHRIGRTTPPSSKGEPLRMGSPELALSHREVEVAVFWAVKHITG